MAEVEELQTAYPEILASETSEHSGESNDPQVTIIMKLINTLAPLGKYDIHDMNIVEAYFYVLENALKNKKEYDELEKIRNKR